MRRAIIFVFLFFTTACLFTGCSGSAAQKRKRKSSGGIEAWSAVDSVNYGRDLLLNTSSYFGPHGSISKNALSGLNCTNCHMEGGTKPNALNFYKTWSKYPRFRGRENKLVNLSERINYCFQRSLNSQPIPENGLEMRSILSYVKWVGENFGQTNEAPVSLALPAKTLVPADGKIIFDAQCARCHGQDGEGTFDPAGKKYVYPPLWGKFSYQQGAGMHRVITSARFIKSNMPQDKALQLTDQEALQVAAYINSDELLRPENKFDDYPDPSRKPVDYPFGPYTDGFSQQQHKYGPFQPIIDAKEKGGK